jgi:hypothetical protein
MAIPHQPVSVFFGATNQDVSRKGVKLADLITAKDCQQVKGGELTKRDGFTVSEQTFEGKATIDPDGLCSPDGAVKVVRDATDDVAYVQGPAGGEWVAKGGSQRLLCKTAMRFPSTDSAKQTAPMFKQSGQWFVWLDDEQHFRVAKQDADGSRLAYISAPIAVNGPSGAGPAASTHVKSFCVVQHATFDPLNLWIFWVDWSTNASAQQNRDGVWALKVPLDGSATSQVCVQAGTASNLFILTGITATYAHGALWLAQCGVVTTVAAPFRQDATTGPFDGYSQHFKVDSAGTVTGLQGYVIDSDSRSWIASGICMLTSPDHSYQPESFFYAFWTKHATDSALANLICVTVDSTDSSATGVIVGTLDLATTVLPATLTTMHNFIGEVTGREHSATGVYIVASVRVAASNNGTAAWADIHQTAPGRIFTQCWDYTPAGGGGSTLLWTKRGAWLAHGAFKRADGGEFIVTGWQDTDEAQMPYHLRRLVDGEIVCQFAYGEGAYPGGCGSLLGQLEGHVNDLQQPYLARQGVSETVPAVVLAATSANVTGTVDLIALSIERPENYQRPADERGLALAPGGIPTIVGGWQNVQEAGPLTYPDAVQAFWGKGAT